MKEVRRYMLLLFLMAVMPFPAMADTYCFEKAGQYYNISPALLAAISYVESNHNPDAVHYNTNGSADYGHMQINSCWKKSLSFRWKYLSDPCYCTMVGAWILRQCADRYGYNWNAVACYHTGRAISELDPGEKQRGINYIRKVQHFVSSFRKSSRSEKDRKQ